MSVPSRLRKISSDRHIDWGYTAAFRFWTRIFENQQARMLIVDTYFENSNGAAYLALNAGGWPPGNQYGWPNSFLYHIYLLGELHEYTVRRSLQKDKFENTRYFGNGQFDIGNYPTNVYHHGADAAASRSNLDDWFEDIGSTFNIPGDLIKAAFINQLKLAEQKEDPNRTFIKDRMVLSLNDFWNVKELRTPYASIFDKERDIFTWGGATGKGGYKNKKSKYY